MSRLAQLLNFKSQSPNEPFVLFALAKEYEKLEQLDTALVEYEALRQSHPDYVGTYYHLGKLYEKLEQPAKAFATYKAGMGVAKRLGDQHSLGELAGAKLNLGDDDDFED